MLLISAIHACSRPGVLAITGGGASALTELLNVPGASNTVLEAVVPYSESALIQFLLIEPDQFCSAQTAKLMAQRAFARAQRLSKDSRVWGLGCSASLVTTQPKKGEHRCFIAICDSQSILQRELVLRKGARQRDAEDKLVGSFILNALAEFLGLPERIELNLFEEEVPKTSTENVAIYNRDWILREIDGRVRTSGDLPRLLFPGSFNPLHRAHRKLAEIAAAKFGIPATFEISRTNVDKPPLTESELERRLEQFTFFAPVVVTNSPRFLEKSRLFLGCTFIVGIDTVTRLIDPKYYGGDDAKRDGALKEIAAGGNSFLVAANAEGQFVELEKIPIPEGARPLFTGLNEGEFRVDESSSRLRG